MRALIGPTPAGRTFSCLHSTRAFLKCAKHGQWPENILGLLTLSIYWNYTISCRFKIVNIRSKRNSYLIFMLN